VVLTVGHICVVGRREATKRKPTEGGAMGADDCEGKQRSKKAKKDTSQETQEEANFWSAGVFKSFVKLTDADRERVSPSLPRHPQPPAMPHVPRRTVPLPPF